MSAYGPKQTWASALHMSAFGGKADMAIREMFPYEGHPAMARKLGFDRIELRREPAVGERHAATRWKRTTGQGATHQ